MRDDNLSRGMRAHTWRAHDLAIEDWSARPPRPRNPPFTSRIEDFDTDKKRRHRSRQNNYIPRNYQTAMRLYNFIVLFIIFSWLS